MNWNLKTIFKNNEEFEQSFKKVSKLIEQIKEYKGQLHQFEKFRDFNLLQMQFEEEASKLYLYAHLLSDLDKRDVENASRVAKCITLFDKYNEEASFMEPEVLSIGEDVIYSFIDKSEELKQLKFLYQKIFHTKEHILKDNEELLISYFNPALSKGGNLYSMLAVADNKNQELELDGKKVIVTQGNWSNLIKDSKEEDRFKIFEAIFKKYEQAKNTYASIYDEILEADLSLMKARGYKSILDLHLFPNNIPTEVYETLVTVAGSNTSYVKKYLNLRKTYLNLSNYRTYHRFLSLSSNENQKEYAYDEAKDIFFKSIEKFPKDFLAKAKMALEEGFVDVLEKDGKRTGAYSSSVPNHRPFILLNYNKSLDNVFTVAHEAGHSIHSLYAMENQPLMLQNYTIFVAEIASTFNEHNLLDYLMNSGTLTKEEQIMLLQKAIDNIIATFYRQTLFAEYELKASRLKEQGETLNYQILSNIMIDLYDKYYGLNIKNEIYKEYVWAYIPHLFYTPFYVYQYATSFAASFKLYQNVVDNKPQAFSNYLNLLSAGGSKYPTEIAKSAGVDFTNKETFEAVVNRLKELVDKLEILLKA